MRKENPARFSSAVGEAWMHCMFKIKYCHKIFDDELYREGMRTLLLEAAYKYEIPIGELGFDDNHVHFMADIGLYSRSEFIDRFSQNSHRALAVSEISGGDGGDWFGQFYSIPLNNLSISLKK